MPVLNEKSFGTHATSFGDNGKLAIPRIAKHLVIGRAGERLFAFMA
jgi:hypothetical protein